MATSATMVARRINLFIQSSLYFLYVQAACTCLLSPRSTHSVQNQNVKVFNILMIFNKLVAWALVGASVGGGRRIRTFGRFTASGFQDQRIRPLCHAPSPRLVGLYDLLGHLSCCGNVGMVGVFCGCWEQGDEGEEVAGARQRAHPSGGGFAGAGRPRRSAGRGGGRGEGGPVRGLRYLRLQPRRVVRGERVVSPVARLPADRREAEEVGPHGHLHPHSGDVYAYLRAGTGGWLGH